MINSDINVPYKNIGELFDAKLKESPDKIFLICPGKRSDTFSYKCFKENKIERKKY